MFVRPAWAYDANSTVNFNVTGKIEEPVCEVSVNPPALSIWERFPINV
jgi:outer membrane usher protein